MVTRSLVVALLVATTWPLSIGQHNLLVNPSFEDDILGTWKANGASMEPYTASVLHGRYSLRCFGRDRSLEGPIQRDIPIFKGHRYVFEGYVKLLNDDSSNLWQTVKVILQMRLEGQKKNNSYIIAYRGFVKPENGWVHLKGSVEAPMLEPISTNLAIRGPSPGVEFLLDNLTLYEVPENPDWMGQAHANIERHRKSDITFNVSIPRGVKRKHVTLEISLKRHAFIFGGKIEEYELVEEPMNQYTKIVYNFFNTATVQAYKWKFNKGGRFLRDFSRATNATRALLENGMRVRGHSIFWDMEKNVPQWVKDLPDYEVLPELYRHVEYMMALTKGKLVQFDVQNEHVHGHYYEERLNNPNITKLMFRRARELDPLGMDLYLNDFTAVTSGAVTEDLHDLAMEYLNEGVPLDGLGIQGHTKEFVKPDPTAMWRRLDRLAETGLDLMMTEFDIGWADVVQRADWLEDAIRAFFGHPKLSGVILWGFWNASMRDPHHELMTGPNVNEITILEPGERWACLTQKEWTTRVTRNMRRTRLFSVRGFQGDYEVIVKRNGVPVQLETFTLGRENITVNIEVTESKDPIDIPKVVDFVPSCISHRAERTIGSDTTSSDQTSLTCRTVKSRVSSSETKKNHATSVSCDWDEVLTGCGSYHMNKSWARNGEKVEATVNGTQCTAFNGARAVGRVRAMARCCKVSGLTCDYVAAGPSFPFDGAMSEARCPPGRLALGCSVYQRYPDSDGVKPQENLTSCFAQSGAPARKAPDQRAGAYVFSACCGSTSGLECVTTESKKTKLRAGKHRSVACPEGYTMTSCNAFADSGRSAGSKVVARKGKDICRAYMGDTLASGSTGVRAFATCCRTVN